jgi:hypothetical protein
VSILDALIKQCRWSPLDINRPAKVIKKSHLQAILSNFSCFLQSFKDVLKRRVSCDYFNPLRFFDKKSDNYQHN